MDITQQSCKIVRKRKDKTQRMSHELKNNNKNGKNNDNKQELLDDVWAS